MKEAIYGALSVFFGVICVLIIFCAGCSFVQETTTYHGQVPAEDARGSSVY